MFPHAPFSSARVYGIPYDARGQVDMDFIDKIYRPVVCHKIVEDLHFKRRDDLIIDRFHEHY